MVYIDVRDRKFQLIFLAPVIIGAVGALLVLIDQPDSIDVVAILLGIWVVVWFIIYLVVQVVLDKMAERETEAESE